MRETRFFAAAGIFLALTAIKFAMPDAVASVRGEVVSHIDRSIDYRAVVTTLSRNIENYSYYFEPVLPEEPSPSPSPLPSPVATPTPTPVATPSPSEPPAETETGLLPFDYTEPVAIVVSSPYGERMHPIDGESRFHYGLDLAADEGTSISAFAEGDVVAAEYSDSYGNYVIIQHDGSYASLYAHCSELLVTPGQHVTKGETIAKVGHTGVATGPHLHFELRVDGSCVDPEPFFA